MPDTNVKALSRPQVYAEALIDARLRAFDFAQFLEAAQQLGFCCLATNQPPPSWARMPIPVGEEVERLIFVVLQREAQIGGQLE